MKLTFYGASRQVTGSMYLLELSDGYRMLIDCGYDLEKGRSLLSSPDQGLFPFEPSSINTVLLTHAHVDHSGNIPNLYREGYDGQVLSTLPTYYLAALLLRDSAMLNAKRMNTQASPRHRRKRGKNQPLAENSGLYFERHVDETLERFVPITYQQRFQLRKGVHVTFNQAGHLLGAANILLEIEEEGTTKRIAFSGDVGRFNYPMLPDPLPLPQVDYLISESTYGGRYHRDSSDAEGVLLDIIQKACIEKSGKLLIPAFSVGRTQALLYVLHKLSIAGKLPRIPIYVDSPMAIESTRAYQELHRFLNEEARDMVAATDDLFSFDELHYVQRIGESKALNDHYRPAIIISASGMLEGGRIQTHLKQQLQNNKATIFFIGYVAEGTMGRKLLDGARSVTIEGRRVDVHADMVATDVFSGHADHQGLMDFIGSQAPDQLKGLFLTHGDYEAMMALRDALEEKGYAPTLPYKGQSFEL
jgi:metallo-beta-lactamase family protein